MQLEKQFETSANSRGQRLGSAARVIAAIAVSFGIVAALPAAAATLDRIKETGHIKLGYFADARPFTHNAANGNVMGFSAELCDRVVENVKKQLGLAQLTVDWMPVTPANQIVAVKQGAVDLLCTPTSETAAKRQDVSYSKPVFPGGVRAVVRRETAAALRNALGENPKPHTVWRGSPASKVLDKATFAVAQGTTTERWLADNMKRLKVTGKALPVADYRTGVQMLVDSKADVFFGDRAVVLGVIESEAAGTNLVVLDRFFTHEPLALALARNDDDFRLVVDRALNEAYTAPTFADSYSKWCGTMDDNTRRFYQFVSFAP
jgi:polar amino acid transport system substrate-binding protein